MLLLPEDVRSGVEGKSKSKLIEDVNRVGSHGHDEESDELLGNDNSSMLSPVIADAWSVVWSDRDCSRSTHAESVT